MKVGDIVRVYRQAPSCAVVGIGMVVREHPEHGAEVLAVLVGNGLRWVWPCNLEVINESR